ncbi:glycosyltransferase family 2 protein [Kitasatospora cineracea]
MTVAPPCFNEEFAAASDSVRAVRLSRNFGHQAGCLAGIREAAGDAVVIIDADLQDPPELIPELVAHWWDGWSVVSARRTRRPGESVFKRASAFACYRLLNAISSQPVALDPGGFRLLDRAVVDLLDGMADHESYLRGAISRSPPSTGPSSPPGYRSSPTAAPSSCRPT